jgi:hypothetical protein
VSNTVAEGLLRLRESDGELGDAFGPGSRASHGINLRCCRRSGFDPYRKERPMNPVIGTPPTLEWIGVGRLAIDESYQRATDSAASRRLIHKIKTGWNWNYCQPLVVSRRLDASLYVIDGQHRLTAAMGRGDIPHLPCVVISGQDENGEASAFVALNTQRQKLSQGDIFNAMLAAGNEDAKHVAGLLAETGWRMTHTSNTQVWKAGDLFCAPMLVKALKAEGECVVRNALAALREAYPETTVTNTVTLLKALFLIYRNKLAADPDHLIEMLGAVSPVDWELERAAVRLRNPQLSLVDALVETIVATCAISATDALLAA